MADLLNPFARRQSQENALPEHAQTNDSQPITSSEAERTSRRRIIQGAAAAAAVVGGVYVKPAFNSFGLPVVLAASGTPPPACGGLSDPCSADSDCCSGFFCKDETEVGLGFLCCPGGGCF